MQTLIMVFLGGGLGSLCRYGISRVITPTESGFPAATFWSNVISCLILGFLIGFFMEKSGESKWQLMLVTGFCGGFSTFSTFSAETFVLLSKGDYLFAGLNILLSVIVCLICIFVGLKSVSLL